MRLHFPTFLSLTVCLAGVAAAAAAETAEIAPHEQILKSASIPTEGPALLAFLKSRTLSETDRQKLAGAVRKLGHRSFRIREQAFSLLVQAGRGSLPYLAKAQENADAEVRARATRAVEDILRVPDESLMAAAARVLAARRPAGTVAALLAYLPSATEASVEEAFFEALTVAAVQKDKIDPAVRAALKDKEAMRRAAAAFVHGRATPPQLKPLAALLKDADARVRFQAAEALVRGNDKAGVPVLIALLAEGPKELAWQVEDRLGRLAGEQAPLAVMGGAEADVRVASRKAWDGWWKANGDKLNLAKLNLKEPLRGLTVISELDGAGRAGAGRVWECGRDGKVRWENDSASRPADARVLPGGNFLAAEHSGSRVTERDRHGKILWEHRLRNAPVSCQRLPNGNTFIATYNELLEVTRAGKEVYCHRKGHMIFSGQKLRDGRIVYAHSNNGVVELDAVSGKEIHTVTVNGTGGWAGVERLSNRHYLVAAYGAGKVVEVDTVGKVYWEVSVSTPGYATRLPNGNTLVASIGGLFVAEYDRGGKEVWRQQTKGRPFRVHRR